MIRRFKFTISVFILFAINCLILFADFGSSAWLYVGICSVLTMLVFMGEVTR